VQEAGFGRALRLQDNGGSGEKMTDSILVGWHLMIEDD
jgi:hypothetical protein